MNSTRENKPTIKIFVSHRTDLISETIENPLYVNVRCGAVYDKENRSGFLGDDTGNNISEKKYQYSELTVQYWAWKNVDVDYYGLCHYRRYLNFSDKTFETDELDQIECDWLTSENAEKFGLLDQEAMTNEISNYDVIVNSAYDVQKISIPDWGSKKSVMQLLEYATSNSRVWHKKPLFPKGTFQIILDLVRKFSPEYYEDCYAYLNGRYLRGYNCFVMKKDLYNKFCSFEFNILSHLEEELDSKYFPESMARNCGYMGEILYGTFIHYLIRQNKYKVKELKTIFFKHTDKINKLKPKFEINNIPILLACSEYYVPYVATELKSLSEHINADVNYDIIIFHRGISSELKKRLVQEVEDYHNISVRFYNTEQLFSKSDFYIANPHSSIESYYKILAPWILENYNKAIILDCDIVIKEDLKKLYDIDIQGFCLGAVKDIVYMGFLNGFLPGTLDYTRKKLKMSLPYNYVNTGVLLADLAQIRNKYSKEEIISFFEKNNFNIQEQDGINAFFENDIKFLDLRWNYYVEEYPDISEAINWAPRIFSDEYNKINAYSDSNYPFIIHYANQPKPWDIPGVKCSRFFWEYAKKTSFYEEIIFRMAFNTRYMSNKVSLARKYADKLLPKGTARREALKKIIPRNSPQWNLLKKIYHFFALD